MMKTDSEIKRDVEFELKWDPDIDATDVGVAVKNSVATLTGFMRSYSQKYQAERDAKRVAGVMAVANDIEVRLPVIDQRPDPEIARDSVAALKAELPYSFERIKAVVKDGWVTLEGDAEWYFQRERADRAVRRVKGVKGVINSIVLRPAVAPADIKRKIEDAFKRSAEVDANNVTVEASGGTVILRGKVRSWAERQEAERTAYSAPGVTKVDNRIAIDPSLFTSTARRETAHA
jgi:osmotically-inducible protein OsmY